MTNGLQMAILFLMSEYQTENRLLLLELHIFAIMIYFNKLQQ